MADVETRSVIVGGNLSDIYRLWANFEEFPMFMKYIKSVTKTGPTSSHWVMDGPMGKSIEWDAETTRLDENKRIAWNSKANSPIKTSGQVTFKDLGNKETEVTVMLRYDPPAGPIGEFVAKLFSDPGARMEEDLRNFKRFAEGRLERLTQ